ncbi:MAG: hypothetical protein ABI592_09560 [Acidobacteriota bacterium]
MDLVLKNPSELAARLELAHGQRLLLVDVPEPLAELAVEARRGRGETSLAEGRRIRSVKDSYDAILVWREDRVGSHAVLDALVKRLDPGGVLWGVVALRKVMGLATPAAHRLEAGDLDRAFGPSGLVRDREVRVTPWHVAHRFARPDPKKKS